MQTPDQRYTILPIGIGNSPPTGVCSNTPPVVLSENDLQVIIQALTSPDRQDTCNSIKASALRLNCIASLIELYETPKGLDEAVKTLESIARFHVENNQQQEPQND